MSDTITIQIVCNSDFCEQLRDEGQFFETIADALDVPRESVTEVEDE